MSRSDFSAPKSRAAAGRSKIWEGKKESLVREVTSIAGRSPILEIMRIDDFGDEIRITACFAVPTLVRPRQDEVRTDGPVLVRFRYHVRFLTEPPTPWGLATILFPYDAHHPNFAFGTGLCLGRPQASISMSSVIHLTWAAITLNSSNTVEWQGLDDRAAHFVRRHAESFPLVPTGLFEEPPAGLRVDTADLEKRLALGPHGDPSPATTGAVTESDALRRVRDLLGGEP